MDDPGFDIYYSHFYETVCEKKEKIMIGILGLILLFSVIIVGGERGAISLIALKWSTVYSSV